MTYEEIVDKVRQHFKKLDPQSVSEHAAVQFNVTGEGEGAFYVEAQPGSITVEPFEYFDRDIVVTTNAVELMNLLTDLDIVNANLTGRISADGDLRKAEVFKSLRKKTARKTADKSAPKEDAGEKPAAKAAPKKAAPKKASPKKASSKKTTDKKSK